MEAIKGKEFFCSWSGGKDSCLALYHAIKNGGKPKYLLTMCMDKEDRTRSHGLNLGIVQAQAHSMSIPIVTCNTTWDDYEENFLRIIKGFKKEGIVHGVFGDIDLEDHLNWIERVCSSAEINPYEPLWKRGRHDLLEELILSGFNAMIIATKNGVLDKSFLGRTVDRHLISELEKAGIDASGEEGEYHTVVTDGPIFSSTISIDPGEQISRDSYSFLDVEIAN